MKTKLNEPSPTAATGRAGIVGTALFLCSVACGSEDDATRTSVVRQPSLCGANDLQEVEAYDGSLGPSTAFVASRERAVGNIKWRNDLPSRYTNPGDVNGVRWCTGTLIGVDLLLTAGHCFDVDGNGWTWPRVNGGSTPISSAAGAEEMLVDFNYQNDPAGNPRTFTTYDVSELVEYRLGSLDYAVLRLSDGPGDASAFGRNVPSPFPWAVGEDVTIIQHPAGQPKQIHAGSIASLGTSSISYEVADTLGGSSGSGLLNELTGYVSGVHTNGGCLANGSGANSGVQLKSIWENSPSVRTQALDTSKVALWL